MTAGIYPRALARGVHSPSPPCPGASLSSQLHAEGDLGDDEAVGLSVELSPGSGFGGSLGMEPGLGFGGFAGAGAGLTGTLATPSIGSMLGLKP